MPRYAYINGSYTAHNKACIHIEDRGFQFADGVYEVIACIHGCLADERGHLDRLQRSLSELGMDMPVSRQTLQLIFRELLRKNRLKNANIYIQVTRGIARRDFPFPDHETTPLSLIVTTWPFRFDGNPRVKDGARVITVPDQRWARRDIKTIALLPQVLAKQHAVEAGAYEAWMLDKNGYITEGSSSNAWIVSQDNKLITREPSHDILRGVTRTAIDKLRQEMGIEWEERPFTPEEAYRAQEAFTTAAVALVVPVIAIDDHKIGTGKPGPVALGLYKEYRAYVDGLRGEQLKWKA